MQSTATPVFHSLADPALVGILRAGGVGVLLTDTVYGLVGAAGTPPKTAARIMQIKGREGKPGTLIAADTQQLLDLGFVREHVIAAAQFWPGPLTVVLRTKPELAYLDLGLQSLPVRIPDNQAIAALLAKTGPLLTTSANRPGEPTVKSVQEAQAIFGDHVDFYVDGGRQETPVASTIIRLKIDLLRQGVAVVNPDALE